MIITMMKILIFFVTSMVVIGQFRTDAAYQYGSSCNILDLHGCKDESLICYQSICVCAPGYRYNQTNRTDETNNNGTCVENPPCQYDKQPDDCLTDADQYRRCSKNNKCDSCINGMVYNTKRQRCVSKLGQPCFSLSGSSNVIRNQEGEYRSQKKVFFRENNLVCRNGIWVCKPNHYPDENWTHCKPEVEQCDQNDLKCQMFADYNRVCSSVQTGPNKPKTWYCTCDTETREDEFTLQCVFINTGLTNFLIMPLFLLPICIMICVISYIGHRMLRSTQNVRNVSRSTPTTSTSRQPRPNRSRNPRMQPDPTKSPSSISVLDLDDLPPSYDIVLREQQRIQEEIRLANQQPSTSSSIQVPVSEPVPSTSAQP